MKQFFSTIMQNIVDRLWVVVFMYVKMALPVQGVVYMEEDDEHICCGGGCDGCDCSK